jgi:hypothetical protein
MLAEMGVPRQACGRVAVWQGVPVRLTNPLWYLASFVVALGSVMIGTAVAASAWDPVRDATITPTTVRVDASGKSLAVFTDIVQTNRDIRCRARGRDKKAIQIPPATLQVTVANEGNQWHLIGLVDEGADGLKVRCAPRDKRVDNASYGYATVPGFKSRDNAGNGIGVLGAAIGTLLAGYVFRRRHKSRKETAREPA